MNTLLFKRLFALSFILLFAFSSANAIASRQRARVQNTLNYRYLAVAAGVFVIGYLATKLLFKKGSQSNKHTTQSEKAKAANSEIVDYPDVIDFENSIVLQQRQYEFTKCTQDQKSVLSTYHVNGCHFVVLYDAEQKAAVAFHWDDETRPSEIKKAFALLEANGMNKQRTQAYFVGGWKNNNYYRYSQHHGSLLLDALRSYGIQKENIDTSHMYERKTPNLPMHSFVAQGGRHDKAHFFMGVAFDVCTGELTLSDELPAEKFWGAPEMPGVDCSEYLEYIPGSGCPLKRALS